MSRPRGSSIVELLVAVVLGLFVVSVGFSVLAGLGRNRAQVDARQDRLLATRIARTALRGELRRQRPPDLDSVRGDSIRLRAFRGTAVVCSVEPPATVRVAYEGQRLPDPRKDSVELTDETGSIAVVDLLDDRPDSTPCAVRSRPLERLRVWTVERVVMPGEPVAARVFESGAYHLANGALRYRLGGGGRQPLTPEVWDDVSSGLVTRGSALYLRLTPRDGLAAASSEFLGWITP